MGGRAGGRGGAHLAAAEEGRFGGRPVVAAADGSVSVGGGGGDASGGGGGGDASGGGGGGDSVAAAARLAGA